MRRGVWLVMMGGVLFWGLLLGTLGAYAPGTHIYLGSEMADVWQSFDPDFYSALISNTNEGLLTKKFYYIGLTMPDLLDSATQVAVRSLITAMHEELPQDTSVSVHYSISSNFLFVTVRLVGEVYASITLDTLSGIYIRDETYEQVQQPITLMVLIPMLILRSFIRWYNMRGVRIGRHLRRL